MKGIQQHQRPVIMRKALACMAMVTLLAPFACGQDDVISSQWLREFEQSAEMQADRVLRREFAGELEQIDRLQSPIQIGDEILIRLVMGSRTVSGRLNGMIGSDYVRVSSTRVLMSDVEPSTRELLHWSLVRSDEEREQEIQRRSAVIEAEMEKRRRFFVRQAFEARGVTPPDALALTHMQLADALCSRSRLGEASAFLQLHRVKGSHFVLCTGQDVSNLDAVLVVGEKPLALLKDGSPVRTLSRDMPDRFSDRELGRVELWCHQPEVGHWRLSPMAGAAPEKVESRGKPALQVRLSFQVVESRKEGDFPRMARLEALSYQQYQQAYETATTYQQELLKLIRAAKAEQAAKAAAEAQVSANQADLQQAEDTAKEPAAADASQTAQEDAETGTKEAQAPTDADENKGADR